MIREGFSTIRDLRRAQRRHRPPTDLLQDDGDYVRTRLLLADDTARLLKHIYDTAPASKPYMLGHVASHAVLIAGLSLVASDNGLRTYLIGKDRLATELPPRPIEGTKYLERNNAVHVKLEPAIWSLSKVMEDDMGLPPDSTLRYGFAILRAVNQSSDLAFALVDARGKPAPISTNLRPDIDLSGPPELV